MKQIAIFSDVHGNLEALQSILSDIMSKNYDEVIYLGDAISIGPQPKECMKLLRESNVKFILGNHELYFLYGTEIDDEIKDEKEKLHYEWVRNQLDDSDREYLKNCSLYYTCNIDDEKILSKKILFSHFLIKDENAPYPFEDIKIKKDIKQWIRNKDEYYYIFVGHEHAIYTENEIEGVNGNFYETTGELSNLWLVGSAGCTKNNKTSYTVLEIGRSIKIYRVNLKYDRVKFLQKLNSIEYPDKENISKFIFGVTIESKK